MSAPCETTQDNRQGAGRSTGACRVFGSLMAPADCAVILIGDLDLLPVEAGETALTTLLEAAERHAVPALLVAPSSIAAKETQCMRLSSDALNPLADPDVHAALAALHRTRLVIGGGPAETALTFTVLGALEEGYDVHLLRDLCLGASGIPIETAVTRMIQAGAVPVSAVQVVAEWGCTPAPIP